MDPATVISTFGIIFLAELGDKTQLTAMALAARYPWKTVFMGIAGAFVMLNLAAVLLGSLLFSVLPLFWIKIASGVLFLGFGVTTLRAQAFDEEEEQEEESRFMARGPMAASFIMITLAELGDKTQLVTASLSAQHHAPLAVFIGSTLALWSVSLIGIFAGRQLLRVVSLSTLHKAAGCLFLLFGAVILFQALTA